MILPQSHAGCGVWSWTTWTSAAVTIPPRSRLEGNARKLNAPSIDRQCLHFKMGQVAHPLPLSRAKENRAHSIRHLKHSKVHSTHSIRPFLNIAAGNMMKQVCLLAYLCVNTSHASLDAATRKAGQAYDLTTQFVTRLRQFSPISRSRGRRSLNPIKVKARGGDLVFS